MVNCGKVSQQRSCVGFVDSVASHTTRFLTKGVLCAVLLLGSLAHLVFGCQGTWNVTSHAPPLGSQAWWPWPLWCRSRHTRKPPASAILHTVEPHQTPSTTITTMTIHHGYADYGGSALHGNCNWSPRTWKKSMPPPRIRNTLCRIGFRVLWWWLMADVSANMHNCI